jgi:hypothetical protein
MDGQSHDSAVIIPINMHRARRMHRSASWVTAKHDGEGKVLEPGHHRLSFRKWLRQQRALRLIGKALRIVEGARATT